MRHRLLRVLLILFMAAGVTFAQEETADEEEPVIFPVTVYLNTVYQHSLGYVVDYNDSELYFQRAYLPGRWFTAAAGKGEILYTMDRSVPYMVVYYIDGEFHHLRLFVHENPFHPSWDQLPAGVELQDEFDVETLQIEY
jgi:hypothetical protein